MVAKKKVVKKKATTKKKRVTKRATTKKKVPTRKKKVTTKKKVAAKKKTRVTKKKSVKRKVATKKKVSTKKKVATKKKTTKKKAVRKKKPVVVKVRAVKKKTTVKKKSTPKKKATVKKKVTAKKKVTRRRTTNYLNNRDMLAEVIQSKADDYPTPKLAKMFMLLVDRYGSKYSYANYTYNDDMRAYALMSLVKTWRAFKPEKSSNPFAFFTQCIKNSFIQYLNQEKKQRNIRDELLVDKGLTPSYTYQLEHEAKSRERHSSDDETYQSDHVGVGEAREDKVA